MQHDLCAYLEDILQAGSDIGSFTSGMKFERYRESSLVRAAVERSFTIIGEALSQALHTIRSFDTGSITHGTSFDFRHRIVHGYFAVDDELVWSATRVGLPELIRDVRSYLEELKQ